jgi:hypothetical protein
LLGLHSAFSLLANPPLPTIPTNIYYVTNYGAVGDGITVNTVSISNAISAAAVTGGTVEITAASSNYMCGPLNLKSSVNFQVDAGATLQMLPIAAWPGTTTFINGDTLHDVEISGSGTIDGNAHFGSSEWWGPVNGAAVASRPNFINFVKSSKILIQNITLQNPPTFHLMLKGNNSNITIQSIIINTPGNSPNTDGMDLGSTNILVQNCYISDGDDNIEIGGSSGKVAYLTVTNCTFGTGHGVSVGSLIQAGVSNVTVVNCSFTGTVNGIRMKSDNDRGGVVQNLQFYNITMTNVSIPLQIYSYYNTVGTPHNITPQIAAGEVVAVTNSTEPTWRNITFSNITIVGGNDIGGIIWGRTEYPVTNVTLSKIIVTAPKTFDIYNAFGVTINDSQFNFTSGSSLTFFNSQTVVSNSALGIVFPITLDGLTTNSTSVALSLYNTVASLANTNLLDVVPSLTLGGTTLTISNNLSLNSSSVLNYTLGTNADTLVVKSNLTFAGTINISPGAGFFGGTYTLATYAGALVWGNPVLGILPSGYACSFNTNTAGKIFLVATPPAPSAPTGLTATASNLVIRLNWNSTGFAAAYNLKRSLVSGGPYTNAQFSAIAVTNYSDTSVASGVKYYYIVTATNLSGESPVSTEVNATPLPSTSPVSLTSVNSSNPFQVSWPSDHLGWRLQIQTNASNLGVGTNWITYAGSTNTNRVYLPFSQTNGSVFLRLVYP